MLLSRYNPNFKSWETKLMEIQKRPYNEGTVIYIDDRDRFQITVTPDTGCHNAYFKICNSYKYIYSTSVIRISFFGANYIPYVGDDKSLLTLTPDEINELIEILKTNPYKDGSGILKSYWQIACHTWNQEWGFAYHPDYNSRLPKGCVPNSKLLKHPQYVPLDTPIPDYTNIKFM